LTDVKTNLKALVTSANFDHELNLWLESLYTLPRLCEDPMQVLDVIFHFAHALWYSDKIDVSSLFFLATKHADRFNLDYFPRRHLSTIFQHLAVPHHWFESRKILYNLEKGTVDSLSLWRSAWWLRSSHNESHPFFVIAELTFTCQTIRTSILNLSLIWNQPKSL